MSASINTEALTRIPLPAILADHGYGLRQTAPGRFLAESPDHAERLSISRLPDGKWLYRDRNREDNKGNALRFLQAHGHQGFHGAAKALAVYTQPDRQAAAQSLLNDLDQRYRDAGREELRRFNTEIPLNRLAEAHGWAMDNKESTKTWEKYRSPSGEAIVINPGKNLYFHQQNKDHDKGGVIQFTQNHILNNGSLGEVRKYLRDFAGDQRNDWQREAQQRAASAPPVLQIGNRKNEWRSLPLLTPESLRYLVNQRGLDVKTIATYGERSMRTDIYRTPGGGERHNVAFANVAVDQDNKAVLSGWEKKGAGTEKSFSGFHGQRGITVFKHKDFNSQDVRLSEDVGTCQKMVLCESSIDALSKAQMDGCRPGDIYVSTGGTPSAAAKKALAALIQKNQPLEVVLAFDNDMAGHGYARQMKEHLVEQSQMPGMSNFSIRTEFPDGVKDWNETLKPKTIEPCPLAPKESESEHIHGPGHGQGISPSQDHSDQPANTLALEIKTERPNRTFRNIEKNQGFER
ncbi:toprim domain-containing protein [Acidithiobacillus sp.]|uniref:toprim domain-containing protein n=1 Tax=Acidithiobacillus sp. TaxID=1872118 RepID=UPI00262EAC63|nr:toprim domain-containing protein [Acidithiobacillus sp.]MDD5280449.1 toprim domain-containing protein [Acidithiobacillus sp.]